MTRLGSLALLLAATSATTGCHDLPPDRAEAPAEPVRAAPMPLTEGAGSVGSCAGNPTRCEMAHISAGSLHNVMIKSDGTVRTWGSNSMGQLGNGSWKEDGSDYKYQAQKVGLGGVIAVAAGGRHTIALVIDGTATKLMGWGNNQYGQMGTSPVASPPTDPTKIDYSEVPTDSIVAIAAGANHSLALASGGQVMGWGNNALYQLGRLGDTIPDMGWVQTGAGEEINQITAVSAGSFHSLALSSAGKVYYWGKCDPAVTFGLDSLLAAKIEDLSSIVAIASGGNTDLALDSDGHVWAWGGNGVAPSYGWLGTGDSDHDYVATPARVMIDAETRLSNIVAVAAGGGHKLALDKDGNVWQWGHIEYGSDGSWEGTSATKVESLSGIVAIAAGGEHSVAIDRHGLLWIWGGNRKGQGGESVTGDTLVIEAPEPRPALALTAPCMDLGGCKGDACSDSTARDCGAYTCDGTATTLEVLDLGVLPDGALHGHGVFGR